MGIRPMVLGTMVLHQILRPPPRLVMLLIAGLDNRQQNHSLDQDQVTKNNRVKTRGEIGKQRNNRRNQFRTVAKHQRTRRIATNRHQHRVVSERESLKRCPTRRARCLQKPIRRSTFVLWRSKVGKGQVSTGPSLQETTEPGM
jgi:hypothetical protein